MINNTRRNRRSTFAGILSANSLMDSQSPILAQVSTSGRSAHILRIEPESFRLEDRVMPVINVAVSDISVVEGDSGNRQAMFTITRSGDVNLSFDVNYSTLDGTGVNGARAGTDYLFTSGKLHFNAGDTTQTVIVPVFGNTILESNREFTLSLSNPALPEGSIPVNFTKAVAYPAGTTPSAMGIGDFNGDGQMDIAVTQATSNTVGAMLWKNGGFTNASNFSSVGKNPVSLAVADYNNDGKADVAVANGSDGTVSVLTGKGTGFFNTATTYTVGSSPTKIVAEDIDADGKMDLVVLCYSDASIYYLKNNGSGFTVQTISGISLSSKSDMIFADINNDGLKDMIVAGNGGVAILRKNAQGGFNSAISYSISGYQYSLAAEDFNKDGYKDLAVLQKSSITILKGALSGLFTLQSSMEIDSGGDSIISNDFNNDGFYDLAFTDTNDGYMDSSQVVEVMLGSSNFTFSEPTRFATQDSPGALVCSDFSQDGTPDLVVANYNSKTVTYLAGRTDTLFNGEQVYRRPQTNTSTYNYTNGIVVKDVNNDGINDLLAIGGGTKGLTVFNGTGTSSPALTRYPVYEYDVQGGGSYGQTLQTADFNNDGFADIATGTYGGKKLNIFLNAGDGTYSSATIIDTVNVIQSIVTGDFNGDSKPDIAVLFNDDKLFVYYGDGNGLFANPKDMNLKSGYSRYLISNDLNRDGFSDLIVVAYIDYSYTASDYHFITTFMNSPAGLSSPFYSDFKTGIYQFGCNIGDVNSDGIPDLIYSTTTKVIAALGSGTGLFSSQINVLENLTTSADSNFETVSLDNNYSLELILTRGNVLEVYQTSANGVLNQVYSLILPSNVYFYDDNEKPLAVGDINHDGKPDIIFSSIGSNSSFEVLLNITQTTGIFNLTSGKCSISDDDQPKTIAISSGDQQSAKLNSLYLNPLVVAVKNAAGNLIQNATVSFTINKGTNNATGIFNGGSSATTNASGLATASPISAGSIPGSFTVSASVLSGSQSIKVDFALWAKLSMTYQVGSLSTAEGDQGTTNMIFQVSRSGNTEYGSSVGYSTSSGTALDGTDFSGVQGALIFAANEITKSITVATYGNTVYQTDRSLNFNLKNPLGDLSLPWIFTLPQGPASGTIVDDDAPSSITVESGNNQSARSGTAFSNPVSVLIRNTAGNFVSKVPVTFSAIAGTNGANGSFPGSAAILSEVNGKAVSNVLTAGTTPGNFIVKAFAQGSNQSFEASFSMTVTAGVNYVVENTTIQEGDSGNKQLVFSVKRSGTTNLASSVEYKTSGVTATEGTDYMAVSGKLNFQANELSKSVSIPVVGNTRLQPDRVLNLVLSNPTSTSGQPIDFALPSLSIFGTIIDDDAPKSIVIGDGNNQFAAVNTNYKTALSVLVKNAAGNPVSGVPVSFMVSTSLSGTPAAFSSTDDVNSGNDGKAIAPVLTAGSVPGSFQVLASTMINGQSKQVTFQLGQQGLIGYSVADATQKEGDSATSSIIFTVTRSGSLGIASSIVYKTLDGTAKVGADYSATTGSLKFSEGQSTASVTVPVIGNTIFQQNRVFELVLSDPSATIGQSVQFTLPTQNPTGSIVDDDAATSIAIMDGNNQSAPIYNTFTTNLSVVVKNAAGNLVSGVPVAFSVVAPSGVSLASFAQSSEVVSNVRGMAIANPLIANSKTGSFTVSATTQGTSDPRSATFNLTVSPAKMMSLNVQQSSIGRSFIRYVDLVMSDATTAAAIVTSLAGSTPKMKITNTGLDGKLKQAVVIKGLAKTNGSKLSIDFSSKGLGGSSGTNTADGSYLIEMDLDGNGSFETSARFHRLLGDVNGDKNVDSKDTALVAANLNKSGTNLPADANGDGKVNSSDQSYVTKAQKRKILI